MSIFLRLQSTIVIAISLMSCTNIKPDFDGDSAFAYLVKQCEFGPRNPGSIGHVNTLNYLVEDMNIMADTVLIQRFKHTNENIGGEIAMANVISKFNLTAEKRIMIGAHWDTRPRSDQDENLSYQDQPLIGANDGASGIAVLLELSRLMKKYPPPIGVDIIFFDGEDFGED